MLRKNSNFQINITHPFRFAPSPLKRGIKSHIPLLREVSSPEVKTGCVKTYQNTLFRVTIGLVLLFISFTVFSQPISKEDREIPELQDKRSQDFEKVYNLAMNGSDIKKYSAFMCYANADDSGCVTYIDKLLETVTIPGVKETGFFALGQIPSGNSRKILNKYLSKENDPAVLGSIIDALGRVGNLDDLNTLTQLTSTNDNVRSAIAMAIARFGLRKIKNDKAYLKLAELMESSADSTLRRNIIFAFSRTADKQTLEAFNTELMTSSTSPEPFARMWGFSALGKEQNPAAIDHMLYELDIEND